MATDERRWQRSSHCDTSSCLEVEITDHKVSVRHSSQPEGPELTFSRQEWAAFLSGVRDGDFDTD